MITAVTPNFSRNNFSNNKINNNKINNNKQQNFNAKLPIVVAKHAEDGNIIGTNVQRKRDVIVDGFEHFFNIISDAMGIGARVESLADVGVKIKFKPEFAHSSKMTGTLVDKNGVALKVGDKPITCSLREGEETKAATQTVAQILKAGFNNLNHIG